MLQFNAHCDILIIKRLKVPAALRNKEELADLTRLCVNNIPRHLNE